MLLPTPGMATVALAGNGSWEIVKQDEAPGTGYVLYRREVSGSSFPEYKLIGMIAAPPAKVHRAARINATDPKYTPPNQTRKILSQTGNSILAYYYVELPVVSDRDVVTRATLAAGPTPGWYSMRWTQVSEGPAATDDAVRMPSSRGVWEFAPADGSSTIATLVTHTDLGGSVPAWIVNSRNAEFVISGLAALRGIVKTMP